jgi:hypothetical protein
MELILLSLGVIFGAVAVVAVVAALLLIIVGLRVTWDVLRAKPWRDSLR